MLPRCLIATMLPFACASSSFSAGSANESLEELLHREGFSGAVGVVRDGVLVESGAAGWANAGLREKNSTATRFALASTSKLFTAVALLRLVEEGALSLEDPVGRFLPDYPNATIRDGATLRHLLQMRSGLGDFFGDAYAEGKDRLKDHSDYLPLFADEPLLFDPGEGVSYSNAGYILLGRIIEKVSGTDFYTHVDRAVFKPLGMTSTGYDSIVRLRPSTAIGYADVAGEEVANTDIVTGRGTAAGGRYSTLADFARFDAALRSGRLISRDSMTEIFGPGLAEGKRVGIAGRAPGVTTAYRLYPTGLSIVVLGNRDAPAAPRVADLLEARSVGALDTTAAIAERNALFTLSNVSSLAERAAS